MKRLKFVFFCRWNFSMCFNRVSRLFKELPRLEYPLVKNYRCYDFILFLSLPKLTDLNVPRFNRTHSNIQATLGHNTIFEHWTVVCLGHNIVATFFLPIKLAQSIRCFSDYCDFNAKFNWDINAKGKNILEKKNNIAGRSMEKAATRNSFYL